MTEVAHKRYVIIVGGGNGARMNTPVPKQFLKLDGKPIIMHSINKFVDTIPDICVILVLPAEHLKFWEAMCDEYGFHKHVKVALSGETRFHSVKAGLEFVTEENAVIGVHDAVRPLVTSKTILAAYKAAEMYGNAIPAIPINDSIRQIESTRNIAVDRSRYCATQTPQCFRADILKKAYTHDYHYTYTDDAMVVEAMGEAIRLVDGNPENIKITGPKDLIIAEALMKAEAQVFVPHKI
ncbi:MAG TPA: 2-C-methyl-D-erythritol 4-phosphate cytidylyltransferase [Bacteroidia bacterium]|jgi:2-C-methyl-D-erythritol 4-phosphate cytidylyltransferase|nr:2-C-methyl-D-erythritol 4-phosphate cytidylyltransferase [Bacteroidia bacterium]